MISFFKFILFLFFCFFLPGRALLFRLKLSLKREEAILFSLVLGSLFWLVGAFCLGWLRLSSLLAPLFFIFGLWGCRYRPFLPSSKSWNSRDLFLLAAAVIFQVLVMVRSGLAYQGGVSFWGVHGHDAVWHLALIRELADFFPGQNPGFAGVPLQNYHYFFDLWAAQIFRWTGISPLDLYFRFLPVFTACLLNGLVFVFGWSWSGKKEVGLWAVFFTAFASSFGFLLPLFGLGSANWETAFWAMQPATALQNPPFYFSLIFLTFGLLLFVRRKNLSELSGFPLLVLILTWAVLLQIKVYGGLLLLAALLFLVFKEKTMFRRKLFFLWLLVSIFSLLFYLPSNHSGGGFIQWQPLWFLRVMVSAADRLHWPAWETRRLAYLGQGRYLALLAVEFLTLSFFVVGNLGWRFLGFLHLKSWRSFKRLDWLLLVIFAAGLTVPLLFTQKYLPWNTIQFFYYSLFVFAFFAARALVFLFKRWPRLSVIAAVFLILTSLPGSLKTIGYYWEKTPTAVLDESEKNALDFLQDHSSREDVILVFPYHPDDEKSFTAPVPLAYYNTAYVSYFARRRVFLEDQTAALIQGYDYTTRYDQINEFFTTANASFCNEFLSENRIKFVYLVDNQSWQAHLENRLSLFFENNRVKIYQVIN